MKLGHDPKTQRALLDLMAEVLVDLAKVKAQTTVPQPETGNPMTGREAAGQLQKRLDEWRKAQT